MSKARRGELKCTLPIGFVYDAAGNVVLDPDLQVQQAVRMFFEAFRRTGSATATVKEFRRQNLMFPRRILHGLRKGEVLWVALDHSRALRLLHHPRYAGAFVYGRSRERRHGNVRRMRVKLPRQEWVVLLPDAHSSYISWEDFERNQELLRDNSAIHGNDRRRSPPREGPALLQGLAICGICGQRMTVRYQQRRGRLLPIYNCQRDGIQHGERICQSIPGANIDEAVGQLVIDAVTPKVLEITLAVQQELEARLAEADALRKKQVERAQYEAALARQRYMCVDPANRLVADSLEGEWNTKLRNLTEAKEQYDRQCDADRRVIDGEKRARILELATDLPRLWRDPVTQDRDRKRMLRLLVEDITLIKGSSISAHVRFRGGATQSLSLPKPLPIWKLRQIDPEVVAEIDRLMDRHTDTEIAAILRDHGVRTYEGTTPHPRMIKRIRHAYHLKSRFDRLREAGLLTRDEIGSRLGVSKTTVNVWRRNGFLLAVPYDEKGDYLYLPPGEDAPIKYKKQRRAINSRPSENGRSAV
ncbi:MAG: recombinase family protein [Phycisphaerae bacterium]